MHALHRLISFGAPWSAALPHVGGMLAAALVSGWLAVRYFRYH
jgi:hypothetical protein